MNESMKAWQGLIAIKRYCQTHECYQCGFRTENSCFFKGGKSPNLWHTPKTIIMSADCPEIVAKEMTANETTVEESDENGI